MLKRIVANIKNIKISLIIYFFLEINNYEKLQQ